MGSRKCHTNRAWEAGVDDCLGLKVQGLGIIWESFSQKRVHSAILGTFSGV